VENRRLQSIAEKISGLEKDIAVLEAKGDQAKQNRDDCKERIGKGLSEVEAELAKTHLGMAAKVAAQRL
jgi:hypothetical protein